MSSGSGYPGGSPDPLRRTGFGVATAIQSIARKQRLGQLPA